MPEPMTDERVTEVLHAATLGKAIDLAGLVRDSSHAPERKEELRDAIAAVWIRGVRELAAEVRRLRATVAEDPERAQLLHELDEQRAAMATMLADERDMAAAHDRTRTERDAAREQVKRVRARHAPQCGGACNLDYGCECASGDLECAECETPHPCPTILDLDRTEAPS